MSSYVNRATGGVNPRVVTIWFQKKVSRCFLVEWDEPALIPAFSPKEKVKRSQRFGIYPRLDWWMRIKHPDDSTGFLAYNQRQDKWMHPQQSKNVITETLAWGRGYG